MRGHTLCLVALAVLLTATGTAVATNNTPPLPAAGVDQTVTPGTTVYLDASGSTDPDGEITGVEWTIETPGGTNQTPDCGTCTQTQFEATTVGQYTVTLSVTDDDGATRSDTLYVTVEDEDGPAVSLSGPTTATRGSSTTLTANADEADASLESISWVVDGEVVSQDSVSGASTSSSFTNSFTSTSNVSVSVVVYDTLGYRGSATRTVNVVAGSSSSSSSGGEPDSACNPSYQSCSDADGFIRGPDGETILVNSNGEAGIQTYVEGELVTIEDPTSSPNIEFRDNGASSGYYIEGDVTVTDALEQTDTGETVQEKEEATGDSNNSGSGSSGGPGPREGDSSSGDGDSGGDSGGPVFTGGGGGDGGGGDGGSKGGGKGGGKPN